MRRVHSCVPGLLLAVSATAWASVEPYPEAITGPAASTRTRAEVLAELHQAIRSGEVSDFPHLYADKQALAEERSQAGVAAQAADVDPDGTVVVWGDSRLMRAKIQAEAAEANRLGLVSVGEGNPPTATAEQELLIAAAGRRAISSFWVVGSL